MLAGLLAVTPTNACAAEGDRGSATRSGFLIEYGFSVSTYDGSAAERFDFGGPGLGFLNVALGVQLNDWFELRVALALEFPVRGTCLDLLAGVRFHVLRDNVYDRNAPGMFGLCFDAMIGYSDLPRSTGNGYGDGLEFRAGPGLRGSFGAVGSEPVFGLYWFLTAHFRFVAYDRLNVGFVSSSTNDELFGGVFIVGIGNMF